MPIISGYSSDEDVNAGEKSNDVFNLSSLPAAKRPRVEPSASTSMVVQAAPDVLAEVIYLQNTSGAS